MSIRFFLMLFFFPFITFGQGFKCDGKMYIVSYVQSTGISKLTEFTEKNGKFIARQIPLSQNRRLNALAYNVLDEYLYALDVDNFELVKISSSGEITSRGRPANLDTTLIYNAGTISPDGAGIFLIGFNPEFGSDTRYYTINLSRVDLYAGWLSVTGDRPYEIHDFATDPISGKMYGYDNLEGSLIQLEVGGQLSSFSFERAGITTMNGLFFNQDGQLYGYASNIGIVAIDKFTGLTTFITEGPEGTEGDACSCPYTSEFTKDIFPREIQPCQEFEVTYSYNNLLGIGQTWVSLTDTFPAGFEILSIESSIVSERNIVASPDNVLMLENLIYLLHRNDIKVKVRAPSDFLGSFNSKAVHWDFPFAFGEYQYSDDPLTEEKSDPTIARVIDQSEIDFANSVSFSCNGTEATITSPINGNSYQWNTGAVSSSISVNEPGWYTLKTESDCIFYLDSVFISDFPATKIVLVEGEGKIALGTTDILKATLNRGNPVLYKWYDGKDTVTCMECMSLEVMPILNTTYEVFITDDEDCVTKGIFDIEVELIRHFYAPTAFSPNGDGINDLFFLQSSVGGIVGDLRIYNRWGNEIYKNQGGQLNDPSFSWDGKWKEQFFPSGVYIWVAEIHYIDGFSEKKSGAITLIGQE